MHDVVSTCVSVADPVCAGQGSASLPLVFRCHQQKQSCPHKHHGKRLALMMALGFFFLSSSQVYARNRSVIVTKSHLKRPVRGRLK